MQVYQPSSIIYQLLLNTAAGAATVSLSDRGKVLFTEENAQPKDHASWLISAIEQIMVRAGLNMSELKSVAVVAGPGSYTGLRVGMAAAKGFCYALNIPLICVNTLELMATAMTVVAKEHGALICPMIDARRDEVFTALYSPAMQEIMPPRPLILDKMSFEHFLHDNRVIFFGDGAEKWRNITFSPHAIFMPQPVLSESFAMMAQRRFEKGEWTDLVQAEPIYLKEFYTHSKN